MQHMVSLVQLGVGLEEYVCWWRGALATRHQHTHSSRPTPSCTKDTICCICKGNYIHPLLLKMGI